MTAGRSLTLAPLMAALACGGQANVTLDSFADSASYAVGMSMGASLGQAKEMVDYAILARGIEDEANGNAIMERGNAQRVLQAFAQRIQEKESQEQANTVASNRSAGDAYRAENGRRPGVQTTASGLQYEVLTQGTGRRPAATDEVTVHYRGTFVDGTEFESSLGGSPVTFAVNGVIDGWSEALKLMPEGSKYRLVLAPELAYGEAGAPPDIGPGTTLVFEVELLKIK